MYRPEDTILRYGKGFAAMVPIDIRHTEPCCEGHATPQDAMKHGLTVSRAVFEQSVAAWRARDN